MRKIVFLIPFILMIVSSCKPGNVYSDPVSRLMWQNPPAENRMPWQEASDYCAKLNRGGYSDWRLPTLDELKGMKKGCPWDAQCPRKVEGDKSCYWDSAVKGLCAGYWSSSAFEYKGGYYWVLYFNDGYSGSYGKSEAYYVRCVRKP